MNASKVSGLFLSLAVAVTAVPARSKADSYFNSQTLQITDCTLTSCDTGPLNVVSDTGTYFDPVTGFKLTLAGTSTTELFTFATEKAVTVDIADSNIGPFIDTGSVPSSFGILILDTIPPNHSMDLYVSGIGPNKVVTDELLISREPIPEPITPTLLGVGLLGIGLARWKKSKTTANEPVHG